MMSGLFDRYFQLLAGRLLTAEYGVIADPPDEDTADAEPAAEGCLC
jgi:hypothetical protein